MKLKDIMSSMLEHWMGRARHYVLKDQKVEIERLQRI